MCSFDSWSDVNDGEWYVGPQKANRCVPAAIATAGQGDDPVASAVHRGSGGLKTTNGECVGSNGEGRAGKVDIAHAARRLVATMGRGKIYRRDRVSTMGERTRARRKPPIINDDLELGHIESHALKDRPHVGPGPCAASCRL